MKVPATRSRPCSFRVLTMVLSASCRKIKTQPLRYPTIFYNTIKYVTKIWYFDTFMSNRHNKCIIKIIDLHFSHCNTLSTLQVYSKPFKVLRFQTARLPKATGCSWSPVSVTPVPETIACFLSRHKTLGMKLTLDLPFLLLCAETK